MADPFACFGDDSDDSDTDNNSAVHEGNAKDKYDFDKARHLMEFVKHQKDTTAPKVSSTTSSTPTTTISTFHSSYDDQKSRTALLQWPNHPPLYLGPMCLSDDLAEGGGRGYISTHDLPAGTCMLIEEPIIKGWCDTQMGKKLGLESIRYILERDNAKFVIECMEELHPKREKVLKIYQQTKQNVNNSKVDSLDEIQIVDMISSMNSDTCHVDQVKTLVEYAKEHNITNSDGHPLDDIDINRLLLTLRYNGFDSGLYLHFSMVNHNEDPNLIKFRPISGDNSREGTEDDGTLPSYYSEARTTRPVRKGEALTLHYLENPREVSHGTRRKILWDQHRFDVGDEYAYKQFLDNGLLNNNERGNHIFESELVRRKFPLSTTAGHIINKGEGNKDQEESCELPLLSNIEKSLEDLEDIIVELQAIFKIHANSNNSSSIDESTFDRAAALELTIGELIHASLSMLENTHHILLSRCRRLHTDAIELLLSNCTTILTEKQSIDLMGRFLTSVQPLLESQRSRLGTDHPDVARTYQDYTMAIQALLSHSPKKLLSLKLIGLSTLEQCSKVEHNCRVEKKRIEAMYPKDVDDFILESVKKK